MEALHLQLSADPAGLLGHVGAWSKKACHSGWLANGFGLLVTSDWM
jgi:hypothetical protein